MLRKNSNNRVAIATILYGDIFDYPLKKEEVWKYQIADNRLRKNNLKIISYKNGFFCLKGREDIIKKKLQREKVSKGKILLAKKISGYISFIPTVKLIGLSGSTAMYNADENDDIDFFIVCKKGTIWLTRLVVLLSLGILGVRRKRFDLQAKDKICINMLIDENNLKLPQNKENLYTAHEIVQMMPLFVRDDTYKKFLCENKWVRKFLPNAVNDHCEKHENKVQVNSFFYLPFETFAKRLQLWYMKKHKTTEVTTDTLLAFHPVDHGTRILKEYEEKLKKYEI